MGRGPATGGGVGHAAASPAGWRTPSLSAPTVRPARPSITGNSVTAPLYADAQYRRTRKYWAVLVAQGGVHCHLCEGLIVGGFDLDHMRGCVGGLHPAHPRCNRAEGGRHGQAWRGTARLARGARSLTDVGRG